MIKEHVNTKELRRLAVDVLEHLDNVEEFGHVGCFDIKAEEVKMISSKIEELLNQSNDYLEELGSRIKESYEY